MLGTNGNIPIEMKKKTMIRDIYPHTPRASTIWPSGRGAALKLL